MWHKLCRTFHPWCPCIKTRCLYPDISHQCTYCLSHNIYMYPRFCFVVFCCGYTISFWWIHAINSSMFVSVIPLALGQSCRCQSRWDNGSNYSYTSSNGNIFRVNGHLCEEFTGEFPAQRPVSRSSDVFFDLCLNKRLSKQSWGWWTFSPPST